MRMLSSEPRHDGRFNRSSKNPLLREFDPNRLPTINAALAVVSNHKVVNSSGYSGNKGQANHHILKYYNAGGDPNVNFQFQKSHHDVPIHKHNATNGGGSTVQSTTNSQSGTLHHHNHPNPFDATLHTEPSFGGNFQIGVPEDMIDS